MKNSSRSNNGYPDLKEKKERRRRDDTIKRENLELKLRDKEGVKE